MYEQKNCSEEITASSAWFLCMREVINGATKDNPRGKFPGCYNCICKITETMTLYALFGNKMMLLQGMDLGSSMLGKAKFPCCKGECDSKNVS